MDYKLIDGDYTLSPSGHIERVEGVEEKKQRIYIRLSVRKGSFLYDENLGSELYKLYQEKWSKIPEKAKQYVIDALLPETDIIVKDVIVNRVDNKELFIAVEAEDSAGNPLIVEVKV